MLEYGVSQRASSVWPPLLDLEYTLIRLYHLNDFSGIHQACEELETDWIEIEASNQSAISTRLKFVQSAIR